MVWNTFKYAPQAFIEYTTAPDIGFYEVHKSHLPKSWFLLYQFPIKVSMKTDLTFRENLISEGFLDLCDSSALNSVCGTKLGA